MESLSSIYEASSARSLASLQNFLNRYDALETFHFSNCAMVRGEDTIYAVFKPHQNSTFGDDILLTSDDLIRIEEQLAATIEHEISGSENERNPFYARLENEIDRAMINMGSYECEFIRIRQKELREVSADQALRAAGKLLAFS